MIQPSLFGNPSPSVTASTTLSVAETTARYGPETLSDTQLIEALLNRSRPGRAEGILAQVGTLGRLAAMGPAELQTLGLSRIETARFAVLQEVQRRSTRCIDAPKICSPRAAGTYLLPKVQGWTEDCDCHPHQPTGILPGGTPLRGLLGTGLAQPPERRSHAFPGGHGSHHEASVRGRESGGSPCRPHCGRGRPVAQLPGGGGVGPLTRTEKGPTDDRWGLCQGEGRRLAVGASG